MNLHEVYFCTRCSRYTDVHYISDKEGGRNKSYCYKCSNEILEPVNYNWKFESEQLKIWLELSPKIDNWKKEEMPDPIGYFTDGLLRWICHEIQRSIFNERKQIINYIEMGFKRNKDILILPDEWKKYKKELLEK